eukprot:TRINITY_DN6439_c0_g1_i3.p4 TRINITY_DN6439_c0_g1~~TRINITY_DN6439_c0_g1_i3.p4  ORF type:complete len:108 (-),score=10.11 TRINITY_DN6439_c0_g1_i3:277-600(-)
MQRGLVGSEMCIRDRYQECILHYFQGWSHLLSQVHWYQQFDCNEVNIEKYMHPLQLQLLNKVLGKLLVEYPETMNQLNLFFGNNLVMHLHYLPAILVEQRWVDYYKD